MYNIKNDLDTGAPPFPIFFTENLQYTEHISILEIFKRHKIMGYLRYANDTLII